MEGVRQPLLVSNGSDGLLCDDKRNGPKHVKAKSRGGQSHVIGITRTTTLVKDPSFSIFDCLWFQLLYIPSPYQWCDATRHWFIIIILSPTHVAKTLIFHFHSYYYTVVICVSKHRLSVEIELAPHFPPPRTSCTLTL